MREASSVLSAFHLNYSAICVRIH